MVLYAHSMTYNYEKLYSQTPNALGEPTSVFVDFFDTHPLKNIRLLDVGCGQGRDALFIARKGHRVVGVDISPSGIAEMLAVAVKDNLPVSGDIADIRAYCPDGEFEVILIDRTLHMLTEPERLAILQKLLSHVSVAGYLLIADERSNIPGFKSVLDQSGRSWSVILSKNGYLFVQNI